MTEIEIRDPDPTPGAAAAAADGAPASESPYKNLLVPLVVVPALIVMVLVLVFALFGSIAGKEDSPRENLDRLLHGGFNESKQAAFNLVRQVLVSRKTNADGSAPEWDIDASFLPELRAAREQVGDLQSDKDVPLPLVLSSILAQLGDPEGVAQLAEMTGLSDVLDPEHEYRMDAAMTLGTIGPGLAEPERELAARTLIGLLGSPDQGLVLVAIAGLQNLPSSGTVPALRGMLTSSALEQRGSAALSLAILKDVAGVPVLRSMLSLPPNDRGDDGAAAPAPATSDPYEEERTADSRKWPPQRVSESRCKALDSLFALGVPPSRGELEWLASPESPDPRLRALAMGRLAENPAR